MLRVRIIYLVTEETCPTLKHSYLFLLSYFVFIIFMKILYLPFVHYFPPSCTPLLPLSILPRFCNSSWNHTLFFIVYMALDKGWGLCNALIVTSVSFCFFLYTEGMMKQVYMCMCVHVHLSLEYIYIYVCVSYNQTVLIFFLLYHYHKHWILYPVFKCYFVSFHPDRILSFTFL